MLLLLGEAEEKASALGSITALNSGGHSASSIIAG